MRPSPASVNPEPRPELWPKPPRADQRRRLERLRAELARLDRSADPGAGVRPLGLAGIDHALPGGGLAQGCLHELQGESRQGAALGFAVALLGRLLADGGHAVWIGPRAELFGPGLAGLGLAPERLLVVRARARDARLWALEEALHSPGLVVALAEVDRLSLIQSRRLQLAAEAQGVSALLLRPLAAGASPSVAVTRWRIAALGSQGAGQRELGPPRWRVELVRCRGGRTGVWQVEWQSGGWHEIPDPLPLAADAGDRSAAAARSAGQRA